MAETPQVINGDFWEWLGKDLVAKGCNPEDVAEAINQYRTESQEWPKGENDYKREILRNFYEQRIQPT